jgi:probable rRNA maturation factor
MNKVEITVRDLQKTIPVRPKEIKKAVIYAISSEKYKGYVNITVCVVADKEIRELNLYYSGRDSATDVLAFDTSWLDKPGQLSADIIISSDTALRNSKAYKTSVDFELNLYAIHGALHMLGYDDNTPKLRKEMYKKAVKYVNKQN